MSLLLSFSIDEIDKKYGTWAAVATIFGFVILWSIIFIYLVMAISRSVHRRRKLRRQAWGEKYGLRLLDTLEMSKKLFGHVDTEVGTKVLQDYPYVTLFQNKSAPMAMHILEGRIDGRLIRTFEFRYITGSGKSTVEHHHTVMAFHFEEVKPYTAIMRHEWRDGLSKDDLRTGRKEIDDAFYIYADDWKLLPNELPDDLANMILASPLRQFVLADKTLVVVGRGRMRDSGYDQMLEESRRLANWFASKR